MSEALLSMGSTSGAATTGPFDDLKKQFSSSNPKIKNVQIKEYTKDDLKHFSVTFDNPDFQDFLNSQTTISSGEFNITLTRAANGNLIFKQVTELDTGGGAGSAGFDSNTMAPMFKDMFWTVIVHVPQVVSSNGIKMDGSTVQWKIPMADVFAGRAIPAFGGISAGSPGAPPSAVPPGGRLPPISRLSSLKRTDAPGRPGSAPAAQPGLTGLSHHMAVKPDQNQLRPFALVL